MDKENAIKFIISSLIVAALCIVFGVMVGAELASYKYSKSPQIAPHCDKILDKCIALEKQYIALYCEAMANERYDLVQRLRKLSLEKSELMRKLNEQ